MTHDNGRAETRLPQRAQTPPRDGSSPPDPTSLDAPVRFDRSQKHPSDFHADLALGALISTCEEPDSSKRTEDYRQANVYALLSLRDAVLELAAVARDIRDGRKRTSDD